MSFVGFITFVASAYFVVALITAYVCVRYNIWQEPLLERGDAIFFGFIWPLTMFVGVVKAVLFVVNKLLDIAATKRIKNG